MRQPGMPAEQAVTSTDAFHTAGPDAASSKRQCTVAALIDVWSTECSSRCCAPRRCRRSPPQQPGSIDCSHCTLPSDPATRWTQPEPGYASTSSPSASSVKGSKSTSYASYTASSRRQATLPSAAASL